MNPLKISASDITPELDNPVTSFTIGFMRDRVCSRIMFCLLSMSLNAERFKFHHLVRIFLSILLPNQQFGSVLVDLNNPGRRRTGRNWFPFALCEVLFLLYIDNEGNN